MLSSKRLDCDEGSPIRLDPARQEALRQTLYRLRRELKLRLPPLVEDERGSRIQNIVGAIDLGGGTTLHVRPKTRPHEDWVASVLSLLVGDDPVDAAGERAAGLSAARPDLLEALAALYAARLERALRRDGPIVVMERHRRRSGTLSGKLNITQWSRSVLLDPARFPIEVNQLTTDNEYARALSYVASLFARASRRPVTRARLAEASVLLRPGFPDPPTPPAGIEHRRLPPQWSVFAPAWSIAAAVLARRSLLGPEGGQAGVSIAIEPWPLLERLLLRSLDSAVLQALSAGRHLVATKSGQMLLTAAGGDARTNHMPVPDGILLENGVPLATFEAKYRDYDADKGPERGEIYQSVAAARAAGSPTAVLVYPGEFPAAEWTVERAGSFPARLFAVGLRMFSYRRGGESARGAELLSLVA